MCHIATRQAETFLAAWQFLCMLTFLLEFKFVQVFQQHTYLPAQSKYFRKYWHSLNFVLFWCCVVLFHGRHDISWQFHTLVSFYLFIPYVLNNDFYFHNFLLSKMRILQLAVSFVFCLFAGPFKSLRTFLRVFNSSFLLLSYSVQKLFETIWSWNKSSRITSSAHTN